MLREANSIIHNGFDLCFNLALNSLCQDVFLREIGFKAFDGVFFQPLFAQFRRHIIGFVCLGVTAHAECFAFDQRGTIAAAHMFNSSPYAFQDLKYIVAIDAFSRHAVGFGAVREILDGELLISRS